MSLRRFRLGDRAALSMVHWLTSHASKRRSAAAFALVACACSGDGSQGRPSEGCPQNFSAPQCGGPGPDAVTEFDCSGGVAYADPSYECDSPVAGPNGSRAYCCTRVPSPDCSPDPLDKPPCAQDETSYDCDPGAEPASAPSGDRTLVCSLPMTDTFPKYCCIQFTSTSCVGGLYVPGCTGDALGFSCAGTATPVNDNRRLVCGEGIAGDGGQTQYCCTTTTGG